MSGQRNKKPSDIVMRRQEYLDNLSMEIENQNLIEQAVNLYKTTQQVMPISQIKDTRTASEKIMDIEKLKINLIKDLEPLANPQLASAMVQGLIQSPLNADNRLLIFAAQSAPELVEKLKKLYKYGIRGDSNDIEQFVSYINKYYSERRNMSDISKKYFQQQGISQGNVQLGKDKMTTIENQTIETFAKIKIILNQISNEKKNLLAKLKLQKDKTPIDYTNFNKINVVADNILSNIYKFKKIISTDFDFNKVIFKASTELANPELLEAIQTYLYYFNIITPNFDQINTLLKEMNRSLNILRDSNYSNFSIEMKKILEFMNGLNDITNIPDDDYRRIKIAIQTAKEYSTTKEYNSDIKGERFFKSDTFNEESKQPVEESDTKGELDTEQEEKFIAPLEPLKPGFNDITNQSFVIKEIDRQQKKYLTLYLKKIKSDQDRVNISKLLEEIKKNEEILEYLKANPTGRGIRMRGRGINNVDLDQGIEAAPRYIKFGKYLINKKKLNDNVLSLRRDKGSMVAKLPAYKMTSNLSNVFKTIVGGGTPTYEQLNQLTEDEKQYLHKVANESDIYDKIKIPTPSKDQEEKDIHSFNVMKGEIMAGNNSKELVHKFKILLLKLSKQNILPKNQVNEVMEDLLEMGY